MAARDWRADEGGGRARVYGACPGCVGARKLGSRQLVEANTPPSQRARNRQCQFQRRTVEEFAKNGRHLTMGRDWRPETPSDP